MFVIFSVGGEGGLGGRLHREEGERLRNDSVTINECMCIYM